MQRMARQCRLETCRRLIQWQTVNRNGVKAGFWINVDDRQRHLCPGFIDPRSQEERDLVPQHQQTSDILLEKISRMETTLQEILLKVDNALQVDATQ